MYNPIIKTGCTISHIATKTKVVLFFNLNLNKTIPKQREYRNTWVQIVNGVTSITSYYRGWRRRTLLYKFLFGIDLKSDVKSLKLPNSSDYVMITNSANRILEFVRRNMFSCPRNVKKLPTQPLFIRFWNTLNPYGIYTPRVLINKIEMVQRRAARFCYNEYTPNETGFATDLIHIYIGNN